MHRRLAWFSIFASLCAAACEAEQHLGTACSDDAGADSALGACTEHDAGDHDAGDPDAPPTGLTRSDRVDLLLVIDDSNSMREEQELLQRELPKMMETLVSGVRDGRRISKPLTDLHVAVTTVDMGIGVAAEDEDGNSIVPQCNEYGNDAFLRWKNGDEQGCESQTSQRFLNFVPSQGDEPEQIVRGFECTAALGTSGCGFEQQLEAPLKALTPEDSPITFYGGTSGWGTTTNVNAGFLRDDPHNPSLLVVVLITDEDDCSTSDTRIFTAMSFLDPSDPLFAQSFNMRCFHNKDKLHPISRYVDGLRALRPGNEDLVVFAALGGVPADRVDANARAGIDFSDEAARTRYYEDLLRDPRMIERPDPSREEGLPERLTPVCKDEDGKRVVYPAPRIVQTAQGFGENGLVQSLCADDFGPAVEALLDLIEPHLPL